MTPGQLVHAVAIALDVSEETVTQHDRNLVIAGLRTKGGRGRAAPHVMPLDAARVFVAVLGSVRAKDSVETVEQLERAIYRPRTAEELPLGKHRRTLESVDIVIRNLPKDHNLIQGLAAVIAEASLPIEDLEGYLKRFSNLGVTLAFGGGVIGGVRGSAHYHRPTKKREPISPEELEENEYCAHGINQVRSAHGTAVMLLGAAFRDNGLRYANPREAYLAGYGTKPQKTTKRRKTSAAKKARAS